MNVLTLDQVKELATGDKVTLEFEGKSIPVTYLLTRHFMGKEKYTFEDANQKKMSASDVDIMGGRVKVLK